MWGVPPQGRADYAFFQHIAKSLDPKRGRAAILFPHGVLFRRDEAALREALVRSDLVECVLGLAEGLFYNSPMPATVVFIRTKKPPERHRKVLFIDAASEVAREHSHSALRDSHQERILSAYQAFEDEVDFAAVVTTDEIAQKGYTLAIARYVEKAERSMDSQPGVDEAIEMWRRAVRSAEAARLEVMSALHAEVAG